MASLAYRTVPYASAIDGVGMRWLITGTEGEIEVTTVEGQWQMGAPGAKLRRRFGKGGEVVEVEFEGDEVEEVKQGYPGGNTARTYQAFLEGKGDRFADFEGSVETHRLLDRILEGAK